MFAMGGTPPFSEPQEQVQSGRLNRSEIIIELRRLLEQGASAEESTSLGREAPQRLAVRETIAAAALARSRSRR
jgi:hypothetical protein